MRFAFLSVQIKSSLFISELSTKRYIKQGGKNEK